jgi:hypothetical protein
VLLNFWVNFIIKSPSYIITLIILEFLTVWVECLNSMSRILKFYVGHKKFSFNDLDYSQINYANPLYHLQRAVTANHHKITDCTPGGCTLSDKFIIIMAMIMFGLVLIHHGIAFYIYYNNMHFKLSDPENSSKLLDIFLSFLINFLDFSYKCLAFFITYILVNKDLIGFITGESYTYLFIAYVVLTIYKATYTFQINYILLYTRLDENDYFPCDKFTKFYDLLMCFLKSLICTNKNLIFLTTDPKNTLISYSWVIIVDYAVIFLILAFTFKVINNIFNEKFYFIILHLKPNIVRLTLTIFLSTYIIIYTFFHYITFTNIAITIVTSVFIALCLGTYIYGVIYNYIYEDERIIYQLLLLVDLYLAGDSGMSEFKIQYNKIRTSHNLICKENKLNCDLCKIFCKSIEDEDTVNDLKVMISYIDQYHYYNLCDDEKNLFSFIEVVFYNSLTGNKNSTNNKDDLPGDSSLSKFKVIYKLKKLIEKHKPNPSDFYFNLTYLYTKINKQPEVSLKTYEIIRDFDSCIITLERSNEIVQELVNTLDSNLKKDLYPLTRELSQNKKCLIKLFSEIFSKKSFFYDCFTFVLTKFIFEKIYNYELIKSINTLTIAEEFNNRLDLINEHVIKDSIFLLKYTVSKEQVIIARASKSFVKFEGKFFEEIFPAKFRNLGKQRFIEAIQNNTESFQFNFIEDSDVEFIKSISLDCKIFRSFDMKEMFILCTFKLLNEDLLIFEGPNITSLPKDLKSYDLSTNYLVYFSQYIEKVLMLTPKLLDFFLRSRLKKKRISFTDIFSDNSQGIQKSKFAKVDYKGTELYLHYKNYFENFFLDVDRQHDLFEDEDLSFKLNMLKRMAKKSETLIVNLNLLYTVGKNKDTAFYVYTLVILTRKNDLMDKQKYFNFIKKISNNKNFMYSMLMLNEKRKVNGGKRRNTFNFLDGILENQKKIDKKQEEPEHSFNSPAIGNTTAKSHLKNSNIMSPLKLNTSTTVDNRGGKITLGKGSDKSMTGYKFLTLIVNFGLIIFCVGLLIIGIFSSQKMTELNKLKLLYDSFQNSFFQTSLTLFYNLAIYPEELENTYDYPQDDSYWKKFDTSPLYNEKSRRSISMGDYANSELELKSGLLNTEMTELMNFIYSSSFKEKIVPIFSFLTTQKSIVYMDSSSNKESSGLKSTSPQKSTTTDMQLTNIQTPFVDSISMFIHNTKASTFEKTVTMVYIFNYDLLNNKYDFSSIKNKTFSNLEKAVYEIIFNYPNYYKNLNNIFDQIDSLFLNEVESIFNLNLFLSLILIALHVILILISLTIIRALRNSTEHSNSVISGFIIPDWVEYLNSKSIILHDLLKVYKIDPNQAVQKILKKHTLGMRGIRQMQEEKKRNKEMHDANMLLNLDKKDAEIQIQNLTTPLLKILFYMFSIYLIYAFTFIIVLNDAHKDILLTSDYTSSFINIEKNIMNSVILLQCILLSNQTDSSLFNYMNNMSEENFYSDNTQSSQGFIMNLLSNNKNNENKLEIYERSYSKFKSISENANSITDCSKLYTSFQDEIFSISQQNFEAESLFNNLIKICNNFPVLKNKNFRITLEELNYSSLKLIRRYLFSNGNYTQMKILNDDTDFYDEFTLSIMILRPIQTFIFKNDLTTVIYNSDSYFLNTIIWFMIGNILVELVIFFVIERKLIRRIIEINEEVGCLTLCLMG